MIELGRQYGGWLVPSGLIEPSWLCYCVGAGGDISFDLALIERYGVTVRAFDPVTDYVRAATAQAGEEPRFSIHEAAVATCDGPLRVQVTRDPGSQSVSAARLSESAAYIELPGRTLRSPMNELGDDHIDLLSSTSRARSTRSCPRSTCASSASRCSPPSCTTTAPWGTRAG